MDSATLLLVKQKSGTQTYTTMAAAILAAVSMSDRASVTSGGTLQTPVPVQQRPACAGSFVSSFAAA